MSISQNFPNVVPSLNLNFARSKKLDPRITFTRSSTATRMNSLGLIETVSANVPRFDHSYNSSTASVNSLGLLVEDTRTNLLLRSQEPATSPWQIFNNGGSSVVNNSATAPDGTTTAGLFTCGTNSDSIYQDVGSISGTGTYALSVFVKAGTSNSISFAGFFLYNTTPLFAQMFFNPITGQVIGTEAGTNIQVQAYPNGWYKLSMTGTGTNALNTAIRFQIYSVPGTTYIWGAQLEQASWASSYIPTVGSQITRQGDVAYLDLPSSSPWYNYSQGSLVFQHNTVPWASTSVAKYAAIGIAQTSGESANTVQVFWDNNNSNTVYLVRDNFVDQVSSAFINGTTAAKVGFAYTTNLFVSTRNGVGVITDTSGTVPQAMGTLVIGNNGKNANNTMNTHISNIRYYPKSLSVNQLENLTK
jgi:hypothetical protein